jgi:2,4-dienoyl-CoA reductase-like NADH-dependent reductase (Old Yellow Enzyme family)/thioredoxin reductase
MPTSTHPFPQLFSPFMLAGLRLRNRVVMAPMSTNLGTESGAVTARQVAFYRERAEGGTGMVIVEFCCVHAPTGRSEHRQLTLEGPAHLDGHQRLVEAITSAGAVACLQLQHGGQGAKRELVAGGVPIVPSDVPSRRDPHKLIARAMTIAEIEQLIECFGRTAELGVQAGYQAFELHGAHGYLLTSFLSPFTNHRDDAFGGDEARRLEFPRRVIQRVRQAIGDRPLIYRISADEFTPKGLGIADMERITPRLVAAGADALHVSMGLGWTGLDKVIDPMSAPEGWKLPYARRLRAATGVPVIAVGQIRHPETAERAVAEGDADLIALGRPLLADPEWARKAQEGRADTIRPCTSCNYCVTMGSGSHGTIGCAENPRAGRELEALPQVSDAGNQPIVVVGGGPGGMAAALMMAQAGFTCELVEARACLGGGLIASAAPPHKDKLTWYQRYLERQIGASGITVTTGTAATAASLAVCNPRLVVLASGGKPKQLPIEGLHQACVHDAYEVLMNPAYPLPAPLPGRPMLVYGGGETGCEAAEYLAERGHEVVLVSRSAIQQLARAAEPIYRGVLLTRLGTNPQVQLMMHTQLLVVDETGAVTLGGTDDDFRQKLQVSGVLIAQGREPDPALAQALSASGIPYVSIGDARKGGRIGDAVHDAYAALQALCATSAHVPRLNC